MYMYNNYYNQTIYKNNKQNKQDRNEIQQNEAMFEKVKTCCKKPPDHTMMCVVTSTAITNQLKGSLFPPREIF